MLDLGDDQVSTFFFAHGPCAAHPPAGFEDYFGPAPHYRFIEPDTSPTDSTDDVLSRIRAFPECETPEDTMRELLRGSSSSSSSSTAFDSESDTGTATPPPVAAAHRSTDNAIRYLLDVVKRHGPFDAVVGYSEGATMAATMLLWQQRRGVQLFKYGVFFAGWPPVDPGTHDIVLADEGEERIEARTLHISESTRLFLFSLVLPFPFPHEEGPFAKQKFAFAAVGSLDPYIDGSMALYNVCDMDSAVLFDHAKGHTLPRDRDTIRELVDVIRDTVSDMHLNGEL